MTKKINILFFITALFACMACSSDDEVVDDMANTIGVFVPDMILEDGDTIIESRSSLVKDGTDMRFSWDANDVIGVFNVTGVAEGSENMPFYYKAGYDEPVGTGMRSRFQNGQYTFDNEHKWVAYSPYYCNYVNGERTKVTNYNDICLSYEGQCQTVTAYKNEGPGAAHLGAYDYMISKPTAPDEETGRTEFTFSHLGSTVRFYMRFPTGALGGNGKKAILKELTVASETEDAPFVTQVNIAIPQGGGTTTSLYSENSKMTSNTMTLYLGQDRQGIEVTDHDYFTAYIEVYPTEINENTCRLYLTYEQDGVKRYLKSKDFLAAKVIPAGIFTQWTTSSFSDPIELVTATLVPWEDVNGGEINTGE